MICTRIRSHDDDRVAKIRNRPLPIRESAVLQHLQEHMENIGVRLLYLVKEDNGKRLLAYGIRELAALLVADIARRRTDETRCRVLLHVLGHVESNDRFLRAKHRLGKCTRKLRLAHARRTEEKE